MELLSSEVRLFLFHATSSSEVISRRSLGQVKLHYDRRSVGQSVRVEIT
jgi:hypothetical protein